ncbi:hypothetical protein TrVE_jg13844 [Triparma verrucosa]|uniref:Serine/threonine-protein phosphatase n=1 Tax=Triparma verrucosa TaxID=1606542 RepID=A0A9W7FKI2_9STRA|nr:hypothetical protein TrVE_jg13844 [Triparma verrucosa]
MMLRRYARLFGTTVPEAPKASKVNKAVPSAKFTKTTKLDNRIEANLTKLSIALSNLPQRDPTQSSSASKAPPTSQKKPSRTESTFHLPDDLTSLTVGDTFDLLEYFMKPPYNHTLHPYYFSQVIKEAISILKDRPAVHLIKAPVNQNEKDKTASITVIGDLHGSLADLNSLLKTIGPPSANNMLLFNGDYVDRGLHSVEVLSVICCLLISSPDSVFLNRGNHEDSNVSKAYGFKEECDVKFLEWDECVSFFESLSVAHLIDNDFNGGAVVVHAGVGDWDGLSGVADLGKGPGSILKTGLLEDITWSDPDFEVSGTRRNETRGAGSFYGMDVVEKVLLDCGVKNFVRSHEPCYQGVDQVGLSEGMRFYTVFTSTDYPNFEGCNLAGVLKFSLSDDDPTILTWESPELIMTHSDLTSTRYDNDLTCMSSILLSEIFLHKVQIHLELLKLSTDGRRVTIEQWKQCMVKVTGLEIDWIELSKFLTKRVQRVKMINNVPKIEETGFIDINHFLDHFEDGEGGGDEGDRLFIRGKMLYVLFKHLDADDSGGLTRSEFEIGVETLNEHLEYSEKFNLKDAEEIFDRLDKDKNGIVDLSEWNDIFK